MAEPGRPPAAADALAALVLFVAVAATAAALLLGAGDAASVAALPLAMIAGVGLALRLRKVDPALAGFRRPGGSALGLALVGAAGMSLAAIHGIALQDAVFRAAGLDFSAELAEFERRILALKRDHPFLTWTVVVGLAPLAEETLFRGAVQQGFATSFGRARALLYASLLFAVAHGLVPRMTVTLALGLYFGAWALRTRSIWPGVAAHALNNGLAMLIAEMPAFNPGFMLAGLAIAAGAFALAPRVQDRGLPS